MYLDVAVFPGEKDDYGKTADDDAGQDEDDRSHHPVEGDDAGSVINAGFASLCTLKTFEHPFQAVLALLPLEQIPNFIIGSVAPQTLVFFM